MDYKLLVGCVLMVFAVRVHCDPPHRPSIEDNAYVRTLFHTADTIDGAPDGVLTRHEIDDIVNLFDTDGNGVVSEGEFKQTWLKYHLGRADGAIIFFHNADTDQDGSLSKTPDMDRVFTYLDMDGNGTVSEAEFMVMWFNLSSS